MNIEFQRQIAPYINSTIAYKDANEPRLIPNAKRGGWEISENEKLILAKAVETWKEYSQTDRGIALLESLKHMDLPTVQIAVSGILDDSLFKDLIKLIKAIKNLTPSSFSIGITFEAEAGLGVNITAGVAIGLNDTSFEAASFLSIAGTLGLDEGALLGVQFAVWRQPPSEIEGHYWDTEIDLGAVFEVGAKVIYDGKNKEDGVLQGFAVLLGGGEEDGADEGDNYIFNFGSPADSGRNPGRGFYLQPMYQSRYKKPNLLIIEQIECVNQMESGHDEVYMTISVDPGPSTNSRYPLMHAHHFYPTYDYWQMDNGDYKTWNCGRSVWFENEVFVQLWNDGSLNHQDAVAMVNVMIDLNSLQQCNGGTLVLNASNQNSQIPKGESNNNFATSTPDGTKLTYTDSHNNNAVYYKITARLVAQNVQNVKREIYKTEIEQH